MSEKRVAYKKGNRKCCFCGDGDLSKEHLWPEWAHPILPSGPDHIRGKSTGVRADRPSWSREGAPKTIQIRAVCKPCNSGWMSNLETTVNHVLSRLIKQDKFQLNEYDLAALSKYFTMKFIVSDQSAMSIPTFSDEERRTFFDTRVIPSGLSIVLYNYTYEPEPLVAQYNKEVRKATIGETKYEIEGHANFTIRFGHLFVQGLFLRQAKGEFKGKPGFSIRAHPVIAAPVNWPPLFTLSMPDAYNIQHMLELAARIRNASLPA